MQSVGTNDKGERKEFPPTLQLEIGEHVVALALEEELAVKTKYGARDVLRVITRTEPDVIRSLWWPGKLRRPPLETPFFLARPEKSNFVLKLPEGKDEMKLLWSTGGFGEADKGAAGVDKSAKARQEILSRFKS
jgi:hypothetical protein